MLDSYIIEIIYNPNLLLLQILLGIGLRPIPIVQQKIQKNKMKNRNHYTTDESIMIYYHVYDFIFKVDREMCIVSLSTERKIKMNKIQLSDKYKKIYLSDYTNVLILFSFYLHYMV